MKKSVIVTSSDDRYFWLLQGLILSVKECLSLHDVVVLDIGLAAEQIGWLSHNGASVVPMPTWLPLPNGAPASARAQTCRPYLPEIVRGYDTYLWLDSDIWVQTPQSIDWIVRIANSTKALVVCPEIHHAYLHLTSVDHSHYYARERHDAAAKLGGDDLWKRIRYLPWLNSGMFAAHATSGLWRAYSASLERMAKNPFVRLIDQVALLEAVLDGHRSYHLPSTFNWICAFTLPHRDENGFWRTPFAFPNERIHILHLAQSARVDYRSTGMLYDSGNYLARSDT
ncbi:hypothetical protein [Azospirillum halopraeferens]|uniref:hypothetical protein n=1 Tax=Azospirillum halopraeferens TaxID=34010 RepID=UPI0012ECAC04|nr:hypothetical protein [Azospirillum halopraeferens]